MGCEMAESVDIRDEMTSAEAGLTFTWFADRRLRAGAERRGAERRRRSLMVKGERDGIISEGPTGTESMMLLEWGQVNKELAAAGSHAAACGLVL
jgi:hypothetical protein